MSDHRFTGEPIVLIIHDKWTIIRKCYVHHDWIGYPGSGFHFIRPAAVWKV